MLHILHYCIIIGTTSVVNKHDAPTSRFALVTGDAHYRQYTMLQ